MISVLLVIQQPLDWLKNESTTQFVFFNWLIDFKFRNENSDAIVPRGIVGLLVGLFQLDSLKQNFKTDLVFILEEINMKHGIWLFSAIFFLTCMFGIPSGTNETDIYEPLSATKFLNYADNILKFSTDEDFQRACYNLLTNSLYLESKRSNESFSSALFWPIIYFAFSL